MTHDLALTTWVNGGSGLLLILLGVFVARASKANRAAAAFAVAAGLFGLSRVVNNVLLLIHYDSPAAVPLSVVQWLAEPATAIALMAFALLYPAPLTRSERRLAALPALAVLALVASSAFHFAANWDGFHASRMAERPGIPGALVGASLATSPLPPHVGFSFALLLLAARFARAAPGLDARAMRQYALMCVGLLIWPAVSGGLSLVTLARGDFEAGTPGFLPGNVASILVVPFAWLAAGARVGGAAGRTARRLAWTALALMLLGMMAYSWTDELGIVGVARILSVAVLAYGITRHDVLGLDNKVRWTLSKTTVAGAFVAVFFVVSESAQQFFGDRFESGYLGILSAGALVFAMAPLSRLADRIAERAVPPAEAASRPPGRVPEHEDMFRGAVRLALRDRRLTRAEERDLFALARGLGLPAERAHDILAEEEGGKEPPGGLAADASAMAGARARRG